MSEENTIFVGNNPNNYRCSKCYTFILEDNLNNSICNKCLEKLKHPECECEECILARNQGEIVIWKK